jgi:hypothetical protein
LQTAIEEWCFLRDALSNKGKVISVWSVPTCYKQDNWSNELVVGQSPAGKNVSLEAKDIVWICRQAKTGEETAD